MKAYFLALAQYHVWATAKLYTHLDLLTDDDYRRDVGLFFKSVHGTCNHLLVAEHDVWYRRFAEGVSPGADLAAELEPDRARLRERLLEAMRRWAPLVESFDEARFAGKFDYANTKGVAQSLPFALTLGHVFNHATHHRGQLSAAVTSMGHACPELDLVMLLQMQSRGAR